MVTKYIRVARLLREVAIAHNGRPNRRCIHFARRRERNPEPDYTHRISRQFFFSAITPPSRTTIPVAALSMVIIVVPSTL